MTMKAYLSILLLVLSGFSAHSETRTVTDANSRQQGYSAEQGADRLLVVAFTDHTINSLKGTASPTSYRRRGAYQSSSWSERISNQIAEDYALEKMTEWPMTAVGVHCVVYRVADKALVPDTINRLAQDERVEIVQPMNVFKTKANFHNDPYFKLQSNLQKMQIIQAHGKATGQKVIIGMIDTGVDIDHPDLSGQISNNENFAKDISESFSSDKHGTAVAGVMVARKDNAKGIVGVAPNAKIFALKACWPDKADSIEAKCNSYTLALAVNSAVNAGINVLNMSLTGPKDPLLTLLLKKAIDKGIIVIASDTGSEQSADNFPASLKGVISVQSIQQGSPGSVFISETISAPGDKVLTTLPYGTYDFISGSSIAAAEVSGIVALLLEIKPDLTVSEVHRILQKSRFFANEGVDANEALNSLCKIAVCAENTLSLAKNKLF